VQPHPRNHASQKLQKLKNRMLAAKKQLVPYDRSYR
jgi:hypothetical protein